MEEGEWPVQELEVFAAAYIRQKDLYTKSSLLHTHSSAEKMKQQEQLTKKFAMGQLAESLKLPNDAALDLLCSKFLYQLLRYVRGCVRECLLRGEYYKRALGNSLPNIAQLAKKLDLPEVVLGAELSSRGNPLRRWAVDRLTMELCSAMRSHYFALGTRPEDLPSDVLAAASAAVFSSAKHVTQDLWLRICSLRKLQLLKLSLVGDRSDLLQPNERLERVDWMLVDGLLMYTPDEAMILTAESLLHHRDLLRALTVLVELLVAARARRPAPHIPLARRTPLWKTVHMAYTDTGRLATVVLLQRRWQQLLHLARAASRAPCTTPPSRPSHPLLVLVAASFPRVISKKDVSWQTLVQHGLVVTTEDIKSISMDDKLALHVDFTQLERCKSTNDVILYITSKLETEHKIPYEDVFSKRQDYFNSVIVDSSENSNCELDDGFSNIEKVTNSQLSLNDINKRALENTIHSNHTITLDSDSEVVDKENKEQDKTQHKPTKNKQYFEIEIDTSKVVDSVSDVFMEVENLKTLDDIENPIGDLDSIDSYKIMKDSKEKAESNIDFIKCEDDNACNNLNENLKTEQQLCSASTMLDPKLFRMPKLKLKRVDETEAWRRYARHNSIDVNYYQISTQNIRLLKMTYLSDSSPESDEEIDGIVKYCYDKKSHNPDLNPLLKRLTKKFWKKNQRLIKLCKPASVRMVRLRENEWPCGGRVVKRVKLPDIDEVRRINRNILTAQVEPINVHNHELKTVKAARAALQAALQSTRELMHTQLAADVQLLQQVLEELFAVSPPVVDHMGSEKEEIKDYSRRYQDWLESRLESAPCTPLLQRLLDKTTTGEDMFKKRDQLTIMKDKSLEVDTNNFETETDDDLDNMLRCTIIKKPKTYADKPETDVATQPFFVSSNENLVASTSKSITPVITGICSLAGKDTLLVEDRTSNLTVRRPTKTYRFKPLKDIVKRPRQPSHDINTTQEVPMANLKDGTVLTKPSLTIEINPIQKRQDESSQCSKLCLPKQYERFSDPNNKLASLTPVIVKGTNTSTITLADSQRTTTQTFTSAYFNSLPEMTRQTVITNLPTSHLLPTLVITKMPTNDPQRVPLMTPLISNTQQISGKTLVPTPTMTAPMPSQVARNAPLQLQAIPLKTPKLSTNTTQLMSTLTMTSPMDTTSQMPLTNKPQTMPGLTPVVNDFNVIGYKLGGEIKLHAEQNTTKWLEPGRIEPPSALTLGRILSPQEYIHTKFNLIVVKLDSSKPLWTVAKKYMILADINLPCVFPTYWTLGTPEHCSQLIWPKSVEEYTLVNNKEAKEIDASSIVIGDVVGNYPIHELNEVTDVDSEMKDGEVTVGNDSDSDSNDGQTQSERMTSSLLRVKSFAKCERTSTNALDPEKNSRDVIKHGERYFKKLTDKPNRYSLMLTSVLSTEECDGLIRDHVPLYVWNRHTGALSPLEVTATDPDQLPERMRGALAIRHADGSFLKDMALKFQHLNSANVPFRENQVYMFAPQAGTLLVATHKDLTDIENANLLLQNSGNS